ncbi:VCBS repeat-containing protein, partial [Pseudomonas delhiensis]
MSSVVAVVKSVIGQVLAVSAEGQRRVLVEGDRIFLGDLVQTGDAGAVALKLPDGRVLDLGRDSQLSANELAPQAQSPGAAPGSTEELQKAIAAGADPTQALAPTAAGPGASAGGSGPAGGGHSFVLLEETGGHVDPSIGYTTSGPGAAGQGDGERQQELAPNLAPSFVDDQGNALAGLQLSTAEDTLLQGAFQARDPNGDSLTYSLARGPANGSLIVNADGTWQYLPNPDYNGADSFVVTVTDNRGASSSLTVDIGVSAVNDAPVASGSYGTTLVDTPANDSFADIRGQLQASDVDGDQLTWSGSAKGAFGQLTVNPDGSYVYVVDAAAVNALPAGQHPQDSFTVTVRDPSGASDTRVIDIDIQGANDTPQASNAQAQATEDGQLTGQIAASDPDTGSSLTFTVDGKAPAGFTLQPDGSWSFDGKDPAYQHLGDGQTQVISIPVVVTDDQGASSTSTLTITVTGTGTNDAPVAQAGSAATGENGVLNGQVPAATDVDGSIAGYQLTSDVGHGNGTLTFNSDGSYRFDPGQDFDNLLAGASRDVTFTYQAKDDNGALSDPQTITITITGSNDAPVAQAATAAVDEDSQIGGQLQASDADQGAQLQFGSDSPLPAGFTLGQDGKWSFDAGNAAYQHLAAGQTQIINVPYFVVDDQGASTSSTLTITVTGTNDAPVAQAATSAADEDRVSTGQLTATDADDGAVLTYGIDGNAPAGFTLQPNGSWSFDGKDAAYQHLAAGETQVISVPVIVTDDQGATTSNTLTITVTGTNDAPVAQAGTATTGENGVLNGQVPAATDVDGSIAGYQLTSDVGNGNGTLTFNSDGSYRFDPGQDFDNLPAGASRDVTFTYQAKDDSGALSDPQTITITVTGTNDIPVARAASATTDENTVLDGQVPAASDVDGSIAGYQLTSGVGTGNGTLTFNADSSYRFAPGQDFDNLPAGASRDVTFTYQAKDDSGALSAPQTVTITVTGTNDAPVAQAATAAVDEDSQINGQLQATDADQGAQLQFGSDSPLPAGFTLGLDGKWSFDASNPAYQHLAEGEIQTISIPVVVTDDQGVTSGSTLTITVTGTNDIPVAQAVSAAVDEDQVSTGQLVATDADDGAVLSFSIDGNAPAGFTLQPNGSWSFDGKDAAYQHLAAGETQVISVPVIVTDDQGATSSSTLTITVTGTNNAPVAQAGSATTGENTVLNGQVPVASDVDGSITSYQLTSDVGTGNGTLTFNSDGSYRFDPGQDFDSLPANVSRDVTFTYQAKDDSGALSDPQTITITVTGTNDAPVAQAATAAVNEDSQINGQLQATDADQGAQLQFGSDSPLPAGFTLDQDGKWSFDASNPAYQHLAAGQTQVISIPVVATDDQGATSSSTLTITVTGTNDIPVAQAASAAADEDQVSTGQLVATDADDGAALTYSINGNAPAGLTLKSDGSWTFDGKDPAYQHLADGETQVINIPVIVTDEHGATSSSILTITVTGTNDAPVAQAGSATTEENTVLNGQVPAASDVDGTIAGYQLASGVGTGNGTLTFNPNGGYTFDPGHDFDSLPAGVSRDVSFTYQAKDDSGALSDPQTITITVTGTNDAPVAQAATAAVDEDSQINGQLQATDADQGAQLQFSSDSPLPAGFTLDQDGKWSFDASNAAYQHLAAGQTQVISIPVVVTDDQGATSGSTLTITVTGTNDTPVAQAASAAVDEDQVSTGQLTATDADDGAVLTFSIDGNAPAGFTLQSNGSWTFDGKDPAYQHLANDETQVIGIPVIVTDDQGATSSSTLTLTITGTNDAPVAQAGSATTGENTVLNGQVPAASDVDGTIAGYQLASGVGTGNGTLTFNPNGSYTFDPGHDFDSLPAGVSRDVTFTYQAKDDSGALSAPQTITITVTGTNDAAVIIGAQASVNETNTPVSTGGQLTVTDVDSPATFVEQTNVAGQYGHFSLAADGTWSYTADSAYNELKQGETLTDTFSVQSADGTPSSVTVNIVGSNDAPVAQAASASAVEGGSPQPGAVANATDGSALTLTITTTQPGETIGFNWTFSTQDYAPFNDFAFVQVNGQVVTLLSSVAAVGDYGTSGPQAFSHTFDQPGTYTLVIGVADSGDSAIDSTLVLSNLPPQASVVGTVGQAVQGGTGWTLTSNGANNQALVNQLKPVSEITGQLQASDIDHGAQLSYSVDGTTPAGFTLRSDGSWVFDAKDPAYDSLAANQVKVLQIGYTVTDEYGATGSSTLTLTITGTNDAPVANADQAQTPINVALPSIDVLGNDTDVDGDTLSVSKAVLADPSQGSVSINADGTLNFVPGDNVSGNVVIHYEISDSHGGSASGSLTVQVGGNTPPQGADRTDSIAEDSSRSFSAADFGFNDADAGQHLQAVRIDSLPGAGSLTFDGVAVTQGQVIAAADLGKLLFTPDANGNGAPYASFGFSVQDSAGAFDSTPHTFTLEVTAVDDPSVLLPNVASMDEDDGSATGNVLDNDSDVDDTLSVSSYSVAGFSGSIAAGTSTTIVGVGSLVINADGSYNFTPDANYHGAVPQITYTTNTGSSSTLDITVSSVNDVPLADNGSKTTLEDTPVSGQVVASDVDGDTLTYTLKSGGEPAHGTLVLDPATGSYTYTPNLNYHGPDSFTVVIEDGHNGTTESTVTLTVTSVNDDPVTSDDSKTTAEDTPVSGQVVATDVDGDTLTYTLKSGGEPAHGTLVLDPATGSYTYTPNLNYHGPDSFTVVIDDGHNGTTESTVTLTITSVNDDPVTSDDSKTTAEDTPVSGQVVATDVDGDILSYTVKSGGEPAHGTLVLDPATGSYTYTPSANYHGPDSFTVVVSDGHNGTTESTVTLTVTSVNDDPVTSDDSKTTAEDTPVSGQVVATDVDGDALTYTL